MEVTRIVLLLLHILLLGKPYRSNGMDCLHARLSDILVCPNMDINLVFLKYEFIKLLHVQLPFVISSKNGSVSNDPNVI